MEDDLVFSCSLIPWLFCVLTGGLFSTPWLQWWQDCLQLQGPLCGKGQEQDHRHLHLEYKEKVLRGIQGFPFIHPVCSHSLTPNSCNPGWPHNWHVAEASLEFPPSPKCWVLNPASLGDFLHSFDKLIFLSHLWTQAQKPAVVAIK